MKIATFNINNVNKRLQNLLDWLGEARPDVICLQELKAAQNAFATEAIRAAGYHAAWVGQRTWIRVAILARDVEPVVTRRILPGDPKDLQSRYIEAAVGGVLIGCLYAPNGDPQPGPKFAYKLAWLERPIAHAATLQQAGIPVALAGDYNVVPTDADIYPSRSWAKDALLQPESRAAFFQAACAGLDRRDPRSASNRTNLHLLGLQARSVAARCGFADRPHPAQPGAQRPAEDRGRGSGRARPRGSERPRAGVGRAAPGRRAGGRARQDRKR
ncbi:exodeoxyribonuclease III [Falsiroseomonas sp. E2-1-a20]|uniref:exodeoxyribonuclease III n=1 Tax=Falsiroseomonas sp. E2-1-a20 TaxID=3239300 RepID=UPI003F3885DB